MKICKILFYLVADRVLDRPVPAEFAVVQKSGRNCVILVDEIGYSYSLYKKGNKNQTWKCSKRKQQKCQAVVKTEEGWVVIEKHSHNHSPVEIQKATAVNLEDDIVQNYFKS